MNLNENDSGQTFNEELAREVTEDFLRRRNARRPLENAWEMCLDFLAGKQYVGVSAAGDVREEERDYAWQSRNVYNHVLPVLDTRLAKLSRVRPVMSVRAASDDDADVYTAQIAAKVLNSTCARIDEDDVISSATRWSETTGTAFYNVGWDFEKGKEIGFSDGRAVYEGDAVVEVVSPFEIFPDDLTREKVDDCDSIIRARVVPAEKIEEVYGVKVAGERSSALSFGGGKEEAENSVVLLERYEKPCEAYPLGRIVTVAGGKVLDIADFPYENGVDGARLYPFIKQVSGSMPGSFFGFGIVERLIPVQRAYNAVRNRKQEFINRISMGVLAVEDGSCDVDALSEDGLEPGRIIVYRQGSKPPEMLETQTLPADFEKEEEKLLDEFVLLGGVNEVSQNYKAALGVQSAAGLQLLLEQDDERLTVPAENIRRAVKETARRIIRMFKQFTYGPRLMRAAGEGGAAEVFYFTASDVTSDDVIFETENELSYSPSQRRKNVLEIISSGLLNKDDGSIDPATKARLLELMGFGGLENGKSAAAMHISRAAEENVSAGKTAPKAESYDDHEIHISEHTRFLVGKEYSRFENGKKIREIIENHLAEHRKALALKNEEAAVIAQKQDI